MGASSNMLSFVNIVNLLSVLATSASAAPGGEAAVRNSLASPYGGEPGSNSSSANTANILAIERKLATTLSAKEKLQILVPDPNKTSIITFQFVNISVLPPTGGTIALADITKFPVLYLGNVAQAMGFMGPCSLDVPHSHPRATEFLTVVKGGPLFTGLLVENGESVVGTPSKDDFGPSDMLQTTLGLYQGTIFPQGLAHFQFNDNCYETVFSSAFDNRDPGRSQLAQTFFSVRPDPLIEVSLGELGSEIIGPQHIDAIRNQIPKAFAVLVDECVRRCRDSTTLPASTISKPVTWKSRICVDV